MFNSQYPFLLKIISAAGITSDEECDARVPWAGPKPHKMNVERFKILENSRKNKD
jgi:hypothetical protein